MRMCVLSALLRCTVCVCVGKDTSFRPGPIIPSQILLHSLNFVRSAFSISFIACQTISSIYNSINFQHSETRARTIFSSSSVNLLILCIETGRKNRRKHAANYEVIYIIIYGRRRRQRWRSGVVMTIMGHTMPNDVILHFISNLILLLWKR